MIKFPSRRRLLAVMSIVLVAGCDSTHRCNRRRTVKVVRDSGAIYLSDEVAAPVLHVEVSRPDDVAYGSQMLQQVDAANGLIGWGLSPGNGRTMSADVVGFHITGPVADTCSGGYGATLTFSLEASDVTGYAPVEIVVRGPEWFYLYPEVCPWEGWCVEVGLFSKGEV